MARCLAVAMSQAPGLSGMPDSGHCSSAATNASCAKSSARPTSRTIRASPAMSLADSIRQIASTVSLTSDSCTALLVLLGLLADAPLLIAQLRRELLAEVLFFEYLADLDHALL